jgi:hypothetical protein
VKRTILVVILTIAVLTGVTVYLGFSSYAKSKIEGSLAQGCPECDFKIGELKISPFKGTALAHFISFSSDPKNNTTVKVKAYHVQMDCDFSKLIRGKIEINKITLKDFKVTVEEKYNPDEKPAPESELKTIETSYGGKFLEGLPEAKVQGISLQNGTLEYIMKKFGKDATLTVSEINAEITPLGTRKEIGPKYVYADLKAKLQQSGEVTFKLRADLFSVANDDKIEIRVQNQNMKELDTFFMSEDGILMSGYINDIHAVVDLTQGIISGDLWADYKDLMLEVKPTKETGALKAALTNVLQKIKIAKAKPEPGQEPARVPVLYQRLPGQGIVKFILMGLKEAAFKAASN